MGTHPFLGGRLFSDVCPCILSDWVPVYVPVLFLWEYNSLL